MTLAYAPVRLGLIIALGACGAARADTWNFEVRLDGKPIGSHRFELEGPPDARTVSSTARLEVKLLGLTLFRYRHEAQERWRGPCLESLQSSTDDDGQQLSVQWHRPPAQDGAGDCLTSYAYWLPALLRQTRLFNPQTGQIDGLRVERLPDAQIQVSGREVPATRWQLTTAPPEGTPQRLTLWLNAADQRWLGLDAQVRGGRLLTYRLP